MRRDDLESLVQIAKLLFDPHHDVVLDEFRRSLGVETDEVQRRTGLAGDIVLSANRVIQKAAKEGCRPFARRAGGIRTAHPRGRQRPFHRVGGVIVEFVILLGGAFPISDIGLVPHLPQPRVHLLPPYFCTQCRTHWYTSSPHLL